MPLLNYKKEFAPRVEIGLADPYHRHAKLQTIRARRKDGRNPKPGQTLYHYTGLRTKACRKLGESVCKSSETIAIETMADVWVGIDHLAFQEIEMLGIDDGFESGYEFLEFFRKTHGLPFYGFLIKMLLDHIINYGWLIDPRDRSEKLEIQLPPMKRRCPRHM